MPAYRAVLFDFFGTLTRAVRRGPQHDQIARALGCDPARMVAILDRSFHDRCRGLLGDAAASLGWVCAQAGGRPTPEALRMALVTRVMAVQADTRLRTDAVPTLRELRRRGLRTAVVSDCGSELPEFLPRLPVAPLLDARVYSVAVGRRKPHPTMYLTACAALRVTPEECLYVGDGGSRELTGAAAVGMTAVRLAADDLAGHLVFDFDHAWTGPAVRTLADVLALVGSSSAGRTPTPV